MLDHDLRQRLIEVAKCRATVNYSELRPDAPQTLAVPLDEINRHEHREGRPLLSAVVTHKDGDQMSGDGFFRIAGSLGSTKKATRSGTGDRNWSECGIIGRLVNDAISLVSNTSAMNALTKRCCARARPS